MCCMAFGRGISVSILMDICILGTYSILFGSTCLDAFWTRSLGLYDAERLHAPATRWWTQTLTTNEMNDQKTGVQ